LHVIDDKDRKGNAHALFAIDNARKWPHPLTLTLKIIIYGLYEDYFRVQQRIIFRLMVNNQINMIKRDRVMNITITIK
jgi:hypothetical protein